MSDNSFSYNKLFIIRGLIIGIIVFVIGLGGTLLVLNVFSLNFIFDKAQEYLKNIRKYEKMSQQNLDSLGVTSVCNMIGHLNMSFFSYNFEKAEQAKIDKDPSLFPLKERLTLKFLPKLFILFLVAGTVVVLLKLVVNLTINTIMIFTVKSDVRVTPANNKNKFKPNISYAQTFLKMLIMFLGTTLFLIWPTIFVYVAYNLEFFRDFYPTVKIIISLFVFFSVFMFVYYNVFGKLFGLSREPGKGRMTSTEVKSETLLKEHFNKQDWDYISKIYNYKDKFASIWICITIIFLVFQFKHLNGFRVLINRKLIFYAIISVVLLLFSIYLCYYNYSNTKDVFNDKNELQPELYKKSVTNIFQAIVKYNYPCIPIY